MFNMIRHEGNVRHNVIMHVWSLTSRCWKSFQAGIPGGKIKAKVGLEYFSALKFPMLQENSTDED
jgi:hypothetical protein